MKQSKRESLLLLPIKNLIIKIENLNDYKKFYANFDYNGKNYQKFSVGDILVREKLKNHGAGEYFFRENANVIFSLTNPYLDNKYYKMLAQIF